MKVSFGYSDSEDRMWIRAGRDAPLWWLTRRMALRLSSEWAALLERSLVSPGEADEGEDGGSPGAGVRTEDDRADRLLREHRAALANPRRPPEDGEGEERSAGRGEPAAPAGASALVYAVDLGAQGGRIRLVLRSAGREQAIVAPRDDSHRLLAAFVSRCRRNGWLEARLPAWLEPPSRDG
jgi:hypothetical protein